MVMQKQLTITDYLAIWKEKLAEFEKLPKDEQKKLATENLIASGVLNSDGTTKKHICTID